MVNIRRFDPFPASLDDFFKGFVLQPIRFDIGEPEMKIKLDVTRKDGAYAVEAEMPGVRKEDIHVTVDGDVVTIAGEVKKEKEEKKCEQLLRSERYFGKIERSFSLPQEVDAAGVNAQYADGVLKLDLPLREKTSVKAIEIK